MKNGTVLFPDKVHKAVTNDYVFSQAMDKYFGFSLNIVRDTGIPLNQVLVDWMLKNEVLVCEIDGRIIELE